MTLSQLARLNLTFDAGQAFVIFDGREFRACRDAAAAIAAVVRAKRWCCWPRSARALRNEPLLYHAL